MNLSSFKKIHEDKDVAVMEHKQGHRLVISKKSLPHAQRKQMEALPLHKGEQHLDQGGDVKATDDKKAAPQPDHSWTANPTPFGDPVANLKSGLGLADGGDVPGDASMKADENNVTDADLADDAPAPAPDSVSSSQAVPIFAGDQPMQAAGQTDAQPNATQVGPAMPQTPIQAQAGAFGEEKAANLEGAKAEGAEGTAQAKALADAQSAISKMPSQADLVNANKETSDNLYKAYAKKTLDPNKYWDNHSKIAAGIGVLLGGIGQAFGARENGALNSIHQGIQQEVERQKNDQDKKMNLWKMNREALGSDLAANLATQNQLYTAAKFKIDQAAAQAKGPVALAKAHAANAQIDQILRGNEYKLSLTNGPTSDNPDPATRVRFLVDPAHQAKAYAEIDAAKNTVQNAQGIMQAFEQAKDEVRPFSGGINTSPTAFIPGMKSAAQKALIARMGPTFQDVEGTVRQAAMDNMEHNVTPQFGDNDATIAMKRHSLQEYLASKSAASTARGYGIDLQKYPMTNTAGILNSRNAGFASPVSVKDGVQYQRQMIGGKSYMVPVK